MRLVDSTERFKINTILPVQMAESLPPNEKIEAETGILIGTFAHPPEGRGNKAIIDVYEDSVLAITSAGDFERILGAIKRLQDEEANLHPVTESLYFFWASPVTVFSVIVIPVLLARPSTVGWGFMLDLD